MSLASRLLGLSGTRAAAADAHSRPPRGGAANVVYSAPGMPQIPEWDGLTALRNGYQASIYVMQPVRIIATALGSLPFRVGQDPDKPSDYDVHAPLARLLGPPQGGRAPTQGPNPATSTRNLWIWSLVQRLIAGKLAWETVCQAPDAPPVSVWPLVAPFLQPIPSQPGSARWFDGYQYQLPTGRLDYKPHEVFYSWRPAQHDWRQPESALQAASMPASLQIALDRYMWALAKNGLSAQKLVITPDFAEDDERRGFEEQFFSEFTGYDNGGKVMFGYYEDDGTTPAAGSRTPPIQVVDLATKPADAQILDLLKAVKDDMMRAWRVPMSWMGDASQRTYENASQEAKNFWQGPVRELAAEVGDDVNQYLAPRFADGLVGWFDFSSVEALRAASIFGVTDPVAAKNAGLIVTEDWRNDVGLSPLPGDKVPAEPALPAIDDSPGGTSMTNFTRRDSAGTVPAAPKAAGLAVKALDTGRVLMLQRALVDGDPAAGCWEFPGGCLEDGEHPLAAAVREWQEETGCVLPAGKVAGSWMSPNGVYVGYLYLVPSEASLNINCDPEDRHVLNPDDPDGDQVEVAAWWNPATLPGMGALRPEARTGTDWDLIATAGQQDSRAAGLRYDVSPIGLGKNWVTSVGGLPPFIRAIAHALIRNGHDESRAIQMAVGIVQNWASGEGHVTAKTRAKAAAALAEWEAKKAAAHATPNRRDAVGEGSTAGLLLPQGVPARLAIEAARHMFVPADGDPRRCATCGKPANAAVHQRRTSRGGSRHAGPHGHAPIPTGHGMSRKRQRRTQRKLVDQHADTLEPEFAQVMRDLFAKQRRATLDRLGGRRGAQMLRAAQQPPDDGATPPPNIAQVFDLAHWIAETRAAVNPVYAAVTTLTANRLAEAIHPDTPVYPAALNAARQALADRGSALAETVSRTTYDAIARALAAGIADGEGSRQLAARVQQVFDEADAVRAETIARTEVIGAINSAQDAYANGLPGGTVAAKEWLATPDHRTREAHRIADGQQRELGQPFTVGGFPMQHPGDPSAPPSLVINCRCTTLYIPARLTGQPPTPAVSEPAAA